MLSMSALAEIDVWRAANLLVRQHGDEAPIHAAMKVDQMLEAGDLDGRAAWLRIKHAAEQLIRKPGPADTPN